MKYIDLGLSVLWADCNIGANTPEEYGNYYRWDEIPKEYEIPTLEQYKELIENCNWEWSPQDGIKGYKVTSKKNGNSIFLPAAETYDTVTMSWSTRLVTIGLVLLARKLAIMRIF